MTLAVRSTLRGSRGDTAVDGTALAGARRKPKQNGLCNAETGERPKDTKPLALGNLKLPLVMNFVPCACRAWSFPREHTGSSPPKRFSRPSRCAAVYATGRGGDPATPLTLSTVTAHALQRGVRLLNRSLGPLLRIEAYVRVAASTERAGRSSQSTRGQVTAATTAATAPVQRRRTDVAPDCENWVLVGYVSALCLAPLLRRTQVERIELVSERPTNTPRVTSKLLAVAAACEALRKGAPHCYFLAIDDGFHRHQKLVRYFERLGFQRGRRVTDGVLDRLLWGGCGTVMVGDLAELATRWWQDLQAGEHKQSL